MCVINKSEAVEQDTKWVLTHYGSEAMERKFPGSLIEQQAKRIAEFSRQWDEATELLSSCGLNLVTLTPWYCLTDK